MRQRLTKVEPSEWIWYGNAGHFICGHWCRFHLCTRVGKYLVSTVGAYVHPRHGRGNEQAEQEWLLKNWPGEDIGCNRKYETMVFVAGEICTLENCFCGMPQIASSELDFKGYMTAGEANIGHSELCLLWASGEKQNELHTA